MTEFNDHDLLIELRSDVKAMRTEMVEIKDNIKVRVEDHENRLRRIETTANQGKGQERIIQAIIATIAVALVEVIIKVMFHL
jgi:predicted component of type VI protein secretion system